MQDVGYAALQIIPSFKGFEGKLEHGTHGALVAAGTSGGRKYGDAAGRSMVSSMRAHAATAAKISAGILAGAGYAGFKLAQASVAEARESQKVGALTERVIRTTGQAAGVTADQVGRLATALSNKTGVDDEVIQSGANMLLTFKNVRNEVGKNNDIFNQSVAVTEDMAAAMAGGKGGNQLDLKSSSILVGKALNDPAKGLTALTRVGVTFDEQQKKTIAGLLKHNDVAGAQKIILRELKSEFGGAAEAQSTLGEKAKVAWGNIEEGLGTALLPLIDDVERAFLDKGVPAAQKFTDWFQSDGIAGIRGFVDEARPLAESVLPAVSSALGDIRDVAKDALPYAKGLVDTFNDMPDWVKKGLVVGGVGALAAKKTGAADLLLGSGGSGGLLGKATPTPVFVTNPGFGGTGVPGVGGGKVPPILPTGKPGGFKLPGFLTTLALGAGVTYGSKDSGAADPYKGGKVGSESDFMAATLPNRKKAFDDWIQTQLGGNAKVSRSTEELISGMRRVDSTSVAPKFSTPGLPAAKNSTRQLLQTLQGVDRPFHPSVQLQGVGSALAQLNSLRAAIGNLPAVGSHGAGKGVIAPGKPGGPPKPKTQRRGKVTLSVGGQDFDGYLDDRIGSDNDLQGEKDRAGHP